MSSEIMKQKPLGEPCPYITLQNGDFKIGYAPIKGINGFSGQLVIYEKVIVDGKSVFTPLDENCLRKVMPPEVFNELSDKLTGYLLDKL
ncbi:Uncharacterised protein [Candidatus Tiddalikarchaeum anstoanum]|nr:Uncharacterised protein [Candidatus Tiddalikarchaeum anstoanum]